MGYLSFPQREVTSKFAIPPDYDSCPLQLTLLPLSLPLRGILSGFLSRSLAPRWREALWEDSAGQGKNIDLSTRSTVRFPY